MKKAVLYGVGVGPGDPELLTIKSVRVLKNADVIGIPVSEAAGSTPVQGSTAFHIACRAVPEIADKESCRLIFPMTRDTEKREAAYRANADRLISCLAAGKSVAFPVLGDPSIYSTYTYVSRLVAAAGYQTETIPGIPSFSAAAAAAGQSLGEDDMQIHIFPVLRSQKNEAGSDAQPEHDKTCSRHFSSGQTPRALPENFPDAAASSEPAAEDCALLRRTITLPGRKILMKGGRFSGLVRDVLLDEGLPAVMVENCGMADEKIYRSPEEFPERAGYYSIILI